MWLLDSVVYLGRPLFQWMEKLCGASGVGYTLIRYDKQGMFSDTIGNSLPGGQCQKHKIFARKSIHKCSWKVSFLFLYFYNFTWPHYVTKSFHVSNSNKEHTVVYCSLDFCFTIPSLFMKNLSKPQANLNLTIKKLLLLIKNISY